MENNGADAAAFFEVWLAQSFVIRRRSGAVEDRAHFLSALSSGGCAVVMRPRPAAADVGWPAMGRVVWVRRAECAASAGETVKAEVESVEAARIA